MQPFFFIYVSIANEPFSDADLIELPNASRRNNELSGITGMLLYQERRFLQILEGDEHAVRQTYERILRDSPSRRGHVAGRRTERTRIRGVVNGLQTPRRRGGARHARVLAISRDETCAG
ncbi:MAG: BLUF domain-containing protein [Chthoniobacterales bacterium]|nr:BLUF domain-containing protein [Chthoniobacterales bacterium]